MTTLILQTDATNRTIKQTIQALTKAKAISSAYKIPYIKEYKTNEKGTLTTYNIQIVVIFLTEHREKSGPKILDHLLKSRSISNLNLLGVQNEV